MKPYNETWLSISTNPPPFTQNCFKQGASFPGWIGTVKIPFYSGYFVHYTALFISILCNSVYIIHKYMVYFSATCTLCSTLQYTVYNTWDS